MTADVVRPLRDAPNRLGSLVFSICSILCLRRNCQILLAHKLRQPSVTLCQLYRRLRCQNHPQHHPNLRLCLPRSLNDRNPPSLHPITLPRLFLQKTRRALAITATCLYWTRVYSLALSLSPKPNHSLSLSRQLELHQHLRFLTSNSLVFLGGLRPVIQALQNLPLPLHARSHLLLVK